MKKIVLTCAFADEYVEKIRKAAEVGAQFVYAPEASAGDVADAHMVIGHLSASLIPEAKKLEVLQLQSAGADAYIRPGALSESVAICNATGAYGPAVSEHMFAGVLAMMKRLHSYRDAQHRKEWRGLGGNTSMAESTVLILGSGDIGGMFARMCRAFGAYTICVRRRKAEKPDFADEVYTIEELDTLLPRADVVAMALPGSPATVNVLSRERIAMLKPNAIVANVGRGSAIDTDALYLALKKNKIGGAFLDVTSPEPLPADHPLWDLANVLITPHTAGGYLSMGITTRRLSDIIVDNIQRYLNGKPLVNIVDRATGYKA